MKDEELYSIWKKYVEDSYLYRIVPGSQLKSIKTKGLNPKNDPHKEMKKDIFALFRILLNLKKKGFIIYHWWGKPVDQEHVIKVTKRDMHRDYIDFSPNINKTLDFYKSLKGGALVNTVYLFTQELVIKKIPIAKSKEKLVKKLNLWAQKRRQSKNHIIKVKASDNVFNNAHFQNPSKKNYDLSPFGSYANFKKAVEKNGLDYYLKFLKNEQLFYVRVRNPIKKQSLILK